MIRPGNLCRTHERSLWHSEQKTRVIRYHEEIDFRIQQFHWIQSLPK